MNSPLLANAIAALRVGVEDYRSKDPARVLSAVRNISAGVLLVFKEKLRAMSPTDSDEALLRERLKPTRRLDGSIAFVGTGRKTVDVQQIKERFESLHVSVDWKRFNALVTVRNDLEHYYTRESTARVSELLADAFVVLETFLTTELNLEPVEVLGEETWQVLLEEARVYQSQLSRCQAEGEKVRWPSPAHEQVARGIRCLNCDSELVKPLNPEVNQTYELEFACTACGSLPPFEEIFEPAVAEVFATDMYLSMTDGGDPPLDTCHECGRPTFHIESGTCLVCQAELQHTECAVCGEALGPDDQHFRGLCAYHKWQSEKSDD